MGGLWCVKSEKKMKEEKCQSIKQSNSSTPMSSEQLNWMNNWAVNGQWNISELTMEGFNGLLEFNLIALN